MRRVRRSLLAAAGGLLLAGLLAVPALAQEQAPPTTAAPQQEGACESIQNPVLRNVCRGASVPAGAVGGAAGSAAGNIASAAGDSALRSFTSAVAAAGQWFLERIATMVGGTTDPNVEAGWFVSQYRVMLAVAMLVALPMLLVSVAQAVLRQDGSQALRAVFLYLPLAGILSAVAPAFTQLLIEVTDWLSAAVSNNAAADARKFLTDTGAWLTALGAGTANPAVPVFGVLLVALVVVLGAISIWLELLLRAAAIYIAVLFLPVGFAAMVWPSAMRWAKALVEFLIAIIFAKVFIVAIVALAAAGLSHGGLGNQFEGVMAGGALLLMAAFTPIALLRLIPIAEAAVATAGHQRAALRQAWQGATGVTGSQMVSQMIQARFRGGPPPGGTSWPTPTTTPSTSASAIAAARARTSQPLGGTSGGATTARPLRRADAAGETGE